MENKSVARAKMPVGASLRSREATAAGEVELFVVAFEPACSLVSTDATGTVRASSSTCETRLPEPRPLDAVPVAN